MEDKKVPIVDIEKEQAVAMANFVLAKFLAQFKVLEAKQKILKTDLLNLEQDVKMRKIKNIIHKSSDHI